MSEMKKYMSIVRLGHKTTVGVLQEGDNIVIQEKIDGANASFKVNSEGVLKCYSRNTELNEDNRLRGFYDWVHDSIDTSNLLSGKIYYGEWNCPHKIQYPEEATYQFYLFDIYDEAEGKYLSFDFVKSEAERLGLNLVPLFYEGKYINFDHLMSFVGKTKLGGEKGEGIVVKNVDYVDRFGNQIFVKLVCDEFREIQKQKAPKDPSKISPEMVFVNTFMTSARIEKLLLKLVDEGIIDDDFGIEDMGNILKNLGDRVYQNIIDEEFDSLPKECENKKIRQAVGKKLPLLVKEIINKKDEKQTA